MAWDKSAFWDWGTAFESARERKRHIVARHLRRRFGRRARHVGIRFHLYPVDTRARRSMQCPRQEFASFDMVLLHCVSCCTVPCIHRPSTRLLRCDYPHTSLPSIAGSVFRRRDTRVFPSFLGPPRHGHIPIHIPDRLVIDSLNKLTRIINDERREIQHHGARKRPLDITRGLRFSALELGFGRLGRCSEHCGGWL